MDAIFYFCLGGIFMLTLDRRYTVYCKRREAFEHFGIKR